MFSNISGNLKSPQKDGLVTSDMLFQPSIMSTGKRHGEECIEILDLFRILIWGEFLPCSLTAILAKVKQLECLATLFQIQENNRPVGWFFDIIVHPEWSQSVKGLKHSIVEGLIHQDGVNKKIAQELFDREFWYHIKSVLLSQYQKKYGGFPENCRDFGCNPSDFKQSIYALITDPNWSESADSMRGSKIEMIARQEGINTAEAQEKFDRKLWENLLLLLHSQYEQKYSHEHLHVQAGLPQNNVNNYQKLFSLDFVLSPSSPFHKDFVPVFQIVTGKNGLKD